MAMSDIVKQHQIEQKRRQAQARAARKRQEYQAQMEELVRLRKENAQLKAQLAAQEQATS
jgi:hypothetical protein